MLNFSKLFGRSPFAPLQKHMEIASKCVHQLPGLFEQVENKNFLRCDQIVDTISKLEQQADHLKNDIRNHLPTGLLLPIDRGNLLEILHLQDLLADKAEDIAVLTSLREMIFLPSLKGLFYEFLHKNIQTFDSCALIINELDDLVESSFGGIEAEKVKKMVHQVAFEEHEVDLIQRQLLKTLFSSENEMGYAVFYQWQKLLKEIASLSNLSESLANRVRMTLETK